MSKFILPINTKSLYVNILNDNAMGHTATVATPLKQGNSYNNDLGQLLNIREAEVDFENKTDLLNELLKNSKSKNIIRHVYVFDKVAVNGEYVNSDYAYCLYVKEEVDPSKEQFGRLKVHYPTTLKYEDADIKINNKEVIKSISKILKEYAFIVKSFEYNTDTKILNFNALIVGENKVPYSKVFINEKGVGNKFNPIFNEINEDYDVEIITLRKYYGECVNPHNFNNYILENNCKAFKIVSSYLEIKGAKNIEQTSKEFPYSLYDLRYNLYGKTRYVIVCCTTTNIKYFNLSIKKLVFCHDFMNDVDIFLVSNILKDPNVKEYTVNDIDNMSRMINSIKFTDEGG